MSAPKRILVIYDMNSNSMKVFCQIHKLIKGWCGLVTIRSSSTMPAHCSS